MPAGAAWSTALDRLADRCRQVFGNQLLGAVLFGSVARGEEFPDSDLDILLVVSDARPIKRKLYAKWEAELRAFAERDFVREVTPHFAHLPPTVSDAGGFWLEVGIDGTDSGSVTGRSQTSFAPFARSRHREV